MAAAGQLEWRRTALDLPLGLLVVLILLQLAVGPGPLQLWALAPAEPSTALPARFLGVGTVSPGDTTRALLLFLTYAGMYALVVNLLRRRQDVERLLRLLLACGGVLAFASIVDSLSREAWLFPWREGRLGARLAGPFSNPDHWASWLVMLAFLGLGASPPTPDWGLMVAEGRTFILDQWWLSAFPGLAIFVAVLAFNLFGDGLNDALNPRLRQRT